jgi:hypothetical protein
LIAGPVKRVPYSPAATAPCKVSERTAEIVK